MRARGTRSLLGPSTKRARTPCWRSGTSPSRGGPARRTARPCGSPRPVSLPRARMPRCCWKAWVVAASRVTHNTGVALAGAAAAAAVSAGVDVPRCPRRPRRPWPRPGPAATRGHWVAAADVGARIGWAAGLAAGLPPGEAIAVIYTLVGTSLATQESVPAAFAFLAAAPGDPPAACRMAASAGGDCDTIAALAGVVGGACRGRGVPVPGPGHRDRGEQARRPAGNCGAGFLAEQNGRGPRQVGFSFRRSQLQQKTEPARLVVHLGEARI